APPTTPSPSPRSRSDAPSLGHALRRPGLELRRELLHLHREGDLEVSEDAQLAHARPAGGVPPQALDDRGPARIDAPALARLQLLAPGVGRLAVAARARPLAFDIQHVVPPRPLGPVLGDLQYGGQALLLARLLCQEGHVVRRARHDVDVEARVARPGRKP